MRGTLRLRLRRTVTGLGVAALAAVGLVAVPGTAAADTVPTVPGQPGLPSTVSADALPTVQINGVAWTQLVVGDTVYVGGNFTSARPAGAPLGTDESPRANLLAYDLTTGALLPWNPGTNGQVMDLTASPDGRTLYVAGQYTSIGGQTRYRVAAFDVATGALTSFRPTVNAGVLAVGVTDTTVFLGGNFTSVNGQARTNVAAVNVGAGTTTQALQATITSGNVQAMVVAPDRASIVVSGNFPSVNGSSNPGYGLARLDAATGALLPLPVNSEARNAGTNAAIVSLESDGVNFYGSGYHFGGAGNIEGSFAADWATGSTVWVEDCHGDTYSVFPVGDAVYSASHKHYCGNSGGFPQTEPWSYHRGTATTKTAGGVNAPDIYNYPAHPGVPSPTVLTWYPDINAGTFTGKDQGPWTVSGNDRYVVMGGEFTRVSGQPQQGLVRFAVSAIAPDQVGPSLAGAEYPLVATSEATGSVRLTWRTNHDPDNETLTYSVYRTTQTAEPIYRTTVTTPFWKPQALTFLDTGREPGASERYRVVVTDPFGNAASSDWTTVTVAGAGTTGAYLQDVLDDAPTALWRLGETSGTALHDTTGFRPATGYSVTRNATGAIAGDADRATTFGGSTASYASTDVAVNAPETYSVEAWFRTTSTRGGKIIGFGNRRTGTSTAADRHLYLDNQGRVHFGMQTSSLQTVNSGTGLNNGAWHHVVGTYENGTMRLYVDGAEVAQRSDVAWERAYWGYWRLGGDRLNGWPNDPTSDYLNGTIDEAAVYSYALPAATVAEHRTAGTTGETTNRAPVPSFTTTASFLTVGVDGSGSTDSDGTVTSYAWAFGDGATATGATASHDYAAAGTYTVTLTVTDDDGATASTTRQVVATDPPQSGEPFGVDAFGRTVSNGWGVADVGGAWTTSGGLASRYAVDGQRATQTVIAGSTMTGALTGPQSDSTEVRVTVSADKVPNGSGAFVHVQGRRVTASDYYGARVRLNANGSVELGVTEGNGSPFAAVTVPGLTFAAGDRLNVRLQVDGTSPTTLRAKVWRAGTTEPAAWQLGRTSTRASLQVPGSVGLAAFLFGSATNGPLVVSYDDLWAGPPVAAVNQVPVASFSQAATGLSLAVDGSGSSDADGTMVGYAWDFGDGGTGTGATASHVYAASGTYPVTLTVTDDRGATGTTSRSVTVTAPAANQAPVAAFTASPGVLSVGVDGSTSSDPDGSVASWAWDFGDGGTATGATASHAYAAAGTYAVTLTVTDDDGASATTSQQVTVTAPPAGALAQDAFGRTVTGGWGTAEVGGAWTSTGTAAQHSVDGARGRHAVAAGATLTAALASVASTSTDVRVLVSPDKVTTGGGAFVSVLARRVTATDHYGARLRLQADGSVQLHVTRGNGSPVAGVVVPGLTYVAGDQLQVRVQATGTAPTTVRAKVWRAGTPEPEAWQTSMTDATASLQVPGAVGLSTFLFGTATNGPLTVSYDDLVVTAAQ
ncbi:PKD domain-containing protein [Actinotalea solisilvae]|uniref:PKD domain-containing protein n=1 Tax=Actinotalea solisilvae TaxID=2072922 RepID=UPI0018F18921|nr:PKD domain-containing protein [Actinotalea solisilvae]